MAKIKEIPVELRKNREIIEGNFVMSLWKNPTELYDDYIINSNKDLITDDGIFYYTLGKQMVDKGIKSFDSVSIISFLKDYPEIETQYKNKGGFKAVKDIINILDEKNMDVYYNELCKSNLMIELHQKGFNVLNDWNILTQLPSAEDVYDYYDAKLSTISLNIKHELNLEDLDFTDDEWAEILNGSNMGLNYGKHSPILNYLTSGLPIGDLTMFASYTGGGKTSFAMANIIIPLVEQKIKTFIIANESNAQYYKILLMCYALTEDLHYYKATRKKIKNGISLTEEDKEMCDKARKIVKEKYSQYVKFNRVYDYDMNKIKKIAKKLAKQGFSCLIYDTMKYNGEGENTWMSLLKDSKDLFQICNKNNLVGIATYQLALAGEKKIRWLDKSCLSNGKQISEVFSEMIFFRDIWDDEYTGMVNDIHAYKLRKDENGKYTSIREIVEIKPDDGKKYKIFFLSKTRNDETGICLLYEYIGIHNKWKEIGYCNPSQKNRM